MGGKPGACLVAVRASLGNDDGIAGGDRHRTQLDPDLRTANPRASGRERKASANVSFSHRAAFLYLSGRDPAA